MGRKGLGRRLRLLLLVCRHAALWALAVAASSWHLLESPGHPAQPCQLSQSSPALPRPPTLSPTLRVRTSRPTSTTVPLHSFPGTNGSLGFSWYWPCRGGEGSSIGAEGRCSFRLL